MLRKILTVLMLIVAMGCAATGKSSVTGEVPRMTKEQLKAKLGDPGLAILDVRAGRDWNAGVEKIAGAVREDPRAFDQWSAKYPKEKTLVLYCA
jgi:predicted sulfurtransferase